MMKDFTVSNPIAQSTKQILVDPHRLPGNQSTLWGLKAKAPSPQVIAKVVSSGSLWSVEYVVAQNTYVELVEVLVFNGDSAARNWRMALTLSSNPPTGATSAQAGVVASGLSLGAEDSSVLSLRTGLGSDWAISFWSDAESPGFMCFHLTGIVVTYG